MLEAKRHYNNDDYVPEWKKVKANEALPQLNDQCGNPVCSNSECQKLITPSFAPINNIKTFFKADNINDPFVLCQRCYCHAYNVFHTKPNCKSCGAVPKTGVIFNQHCPDAQLVTEHLRTIIDSDILITSQDILCYSC